MTSYCSEDKKPTSLTLPMRFCMGRHFPAYTPSSHVTAPSTFLFQSLWLSLKSPLCAMLSFTTGRMPILSPLPGRFSASLLSIDLVYATSFFRPQLNYTFLDKPSLILPWKPSAPVTCPHVLLLVSFVSYGTILIKRLSFTHPMFVSSTRLHNKEASLFY